MLCHCREAVVICVKNLAGFVSVNPDGSWVCISERKHKEEHHEDPVSAVASCIKLLYVQSTPHK